jgi:hypothetical protein
MPRTQAPKPTPRMQVAATPGRLTHRPAAESWSAAWSKGSARRREGAGQVTDAFGVPIRARARLGRRGGGVSRKGVPFFAAQVGRMIASAEAPRLAA